MPIRILAVGKKHESWVIEGIERYEKRLRPPFNSEWVLIGHSGFEADRASQEESERILSRLSPGDYVVLLDEVGKMLTSPTLSSILATQFNNSRQVVFVIGGAYGVNDAVRQRADLVWSLSNLVLPHQLVRLVLTEQIYRSQSIQNNSSYHHD